MEISIVGLINIVASAALLAVFNLLLKKASQRMTLLFWANLFTYAGFVGIFLFRRFVLNHDVYAIEELIHQFTFVNAPLYFLFGICFVGSLAIIAHLMKRYDVSVISAMGQVNIFFTALGFFLLGDVIGMPTLISSCIVFVGALISGINNFSFRNPLRPFMKIPRKLLWGIFAESILYSATLVITFMLTKETAIDQYILHALAHVFPFSYHHPFYFNVGARFFVTLAFAIYLWREGTRLKSVVRYLKQNTSLIVGASSAYLGSVLTFYAAFGASEDKQLIVALSKLYIPFVIALSYLTLGEKITAPKIVGAALIIGGSFVGVYL